MLTLLDRCHEDGDCLVWPGACNNGHPGVRIKGKNMLVRRVLWAATHGPIPPGHIVHMTCNTPRCVNPEHIELTTYQCLGKKLGALGVMSGPVRSAAIARTKRKTHAKLTDAAVHDIRNSDETVQVLSQRYGVARAHISKVRLYKAWRDFSSPFAGLGALR